MSSSIASSASELHPRARAMGMLGAWTAFALNEAYAITSGIGYLSAASPTDPIRDPYLSIMCLSIVLMAPFLVLTMVAVHAYAPPGHKTHSLAALAFMTLLAGITSTVNFSLFVAARQPGPTPALWTASFIAPGWPPIPQSIDLFAWDWFFALSMLLAAPVFGGSNLQRAVRVVMLISAALCLIGLAWLPFSPPQATLIGILGWGVAGPIVFLLLANLFTRLNPVTAL